MMDWFNLSPLSWDGICTAVVVGGIVGLERQIRGRPVGIRTASLICLGTYVFVKLGTSLSGHTLDPTRVLGQVITGVGFLGAGVMLSRDGRVLGVTSAAAIWVLAAIGAAIGFDMFHVATALAVIVVVILVGVNTLEKYFLKLRRGVHRSTESVQQDHEHDVASGKDSN